MLIDGLLYLFIFVSLIDIAHITMYLTGANLYDMRKFRADYRRSVRALTAPEESDKAKAVKEPLVSVLIPAHNEELSIIRCLESVTSSLHKNLQIIVIDDASHDKTRKLVKAYIKAHPEAGIEMLWKRKNAGKAGAMNTALRTKAKGEFIMTLDADSVIAETAIGNAVRHFDDPNIVGVAANVRVISSNTLLSLLQTFEYIISYRSKKFYSITNSEFVIGGVASTYRMSTLKKVGFYDEDILTEDIGLSLKIVALGNKRNRIMYGADIVAMTEGVQTLNALLRQRYRWKMGNMQSLLKYRYLFANLNRKYTLSLTLYRIPMAFVGEILVLLQPFVIGFIAYVCLQTMNTGLVFGAYLTISIYIVWNIVHDEHMGFKGKLRLVGYVPLMYFISYTMNVVQLYAVIRCLINHRQVRRKIHTTNRWTSPERSGDTQVQFT